MLSTEAPWWNPASPQDGRPIVRHAPDEDNYHYPDSRQLERMRSGVGQPLVVPRALRDGSSPGFDARVPGVVHVDPNAPDGGAIVDLRAIRPSDMEEALATSSYPHQVFYRLGRNPRDLDGDHPAPPAQPEEPARTAPLGTGYVVPRAGRDGAPAGFDAMTARIQNGHVPPANQPPLYAIVQEQTMSPTPPLSSLPPLVPAGSHAGSPAVSPAPYAPAPAMAAPPHPYPAAPQPYQPVYQPIYPPGPDPAVVQMMNSMAQAVQALQAQVSALAEPPRPATQHRPLGQLTTQPLARNGGRSRRSSTYDDEEPRPLPRRPPRHATDNGYDDDEEAPSTRRPKNAFEEEVDAGDFKAHAPSSHPARQSRHPRRQTLRELEERDEQEVESNGLIVGFETLNISYVKGPIPEKARRQVFFEFPQTGKQSARFHEVIEAENSVTLVYDTRYEEGTQYMPPDLGEEVIKLSVPSLKKTYTVCSMGICYPHGVFDHIVLIKRQPEDVEPLDFDEAG